MKTLIVTPISTLVLRMKPDDQVCLKGDDWGAGYVIVAEDWDKVPVFGGEYILCAMYEGAQHAGLYLGEEEGVAHEVFGFSWAVLPETLEEAKHLREHCPRHDFPDLLVGGPEDPEPTLGGKSIKELKGQM